MNIFKKDTRGSGDAGGYGSYSPLGCVGRGGGGPASAGLYAPENKVQTKCEDCGAYIEKINKVVTDTGREFYFCGRCKKPYSRMEGGLFTHYVYTYFAEVEVDEDGTPVGYVKAKNK